MTTKKTRPVQAPAARRARITATPVEPANAATAAVVAPACSLGTGDPAPTFSSPDMIFREIVQGLYKGNYVPGQRLVEADLTQKWGVGRGTVREALNRLAAEGIVILNRHRGATIRVLEPVEMQDILAVLEAMIGMAAQLAAKHFAVGSNRQWFEESFEALLAFRSRPDFLELLHVCNRFYRTLAMIGGNRELQTLLARMHVHLLRVQPSAMHEGLVTERFDDYLRTGEAVLAGNARKAEFAARRHVRATRDVFDQVLG